MKDQGLELVPVRRVCALTGQHIPNTHTHTLTLTLALTGLLTTPITYPPLTLTPAPPYLPSPFMTVIDSH